MSIVSLGAYGEGRSCGYCGKDDSASSFGFYSWQMSVDTYEAMLNRGWRRFPVSAASADHGIGAADTCTSPIYGIHAAVCIRCGSVAMHRSFKVRMEAKNFKPRREYRKDVNRFNRFIKGDDWDDQISHYNKQLQLQQRCAMNIRKLTAQTVEKIS